MPKDQLKKMREVLNNMERNSEPFTEYMIRDELGNIKKGLKDSGIKIEDELAAELMAFSFTPDYQNDDFGWGTYYGPLGVFKGEDGQFYEVPSIKKIDGNILSYWENRARESHHPVLRIRYSDLVWDFSKHVKGESADIGMARTLIDYTIEYTKECRHKHQVDTITKLKRAFSVSLSIKDKERQNKLIETMIEYVERIAQDNLPGLWGFCFDTLIESGIQIENPEIEYKIINNLEDRLERISTRDANDRDPFSAKECALRLARYYRKKERPEDVKRVLEIYSNTFLEASEIAGPLVGSAWLYEVYKVYHSFGLRSETQKIEAKMRELEKKVPDEMGTISSEVKMDRKKIDDYIDSFTKGDFEDNLNKIAAHFIPNKDDAEKQVKEIAKDHPFLAMLPRAFTDHSGRTVSQVGSCETDMEGRIVLQISQNMSFESFFLNKIISRLEENNFDVNSLLEHIFKAPIFLNHQKYILKLCFERYKENDYISFASVLIPQIESAIRNLLNMIGGNIYRLGQSGGMNFRLLGDILRDEMITKCLGEDIVCYFRVLFTDQRGWNLRNIVCHGIYIPKEINKNVAHRLIHVLLVLSLLRELDQ